MRIITEDVFSQEFKIYRELTPNKEYKTSLALKEQPDGTLFTVVLKEVDWKHAQIYEMLIPYQNPYMAAVYDVLCVTSADEKKPDQYFAVTEYVYALGSKTEKSLSLTQFIEQNGPLSEKQALALGIQICEGLKPAHQCGLVHRDIKPDNIMMACCDPMALSIKIIDFGGGKQFYKYQLVDTTVVGTMGFQAPETLSSNTTERADVYSIGCLLNYMLTGQEPGRVRYKGRHNIVSLIETATADDPYRRYSSVDLLQRWLKHEYGVRWIDRVPILREVPGFRTGNIWKEIVAVISFPFIGLIILLSLTGGWYIIVSMFMIYIWPIIVICNVGNLLRFLPESWRRNTTRFVLARVFLILGGYLVVLIYSIFFNISQ